MTSEKRSKYHPITFLKSFKHAFRGIALSLEERNMQFHVLAVFGVTMAGVYFDLNMYEWLFILMAFGFVMTAEILNTAIESVCNNLRDDLNLSYKATRNARDIASGGVLISAIISLIVALIIFMPKFADLFV